MVDFPSLFACQKSIAFFPGWLPPEPETDWVSFSAPLEIDGVVEAGFQLHGGCFKNFPDVNVSFELVMARSATTKRVVIERFDWRSLRGGHSNKRRRLAGIPSRTQRTHLHRFDLNYQPSRDRMISGLPFADNVACSLETFDSVKEFLRNRFNISNMHVVTPPEWVYDLFHGADGTLAE